MEETGGGCAGEVGSGWLAEGAATAAGMGNRGATGGETEGEGAPPPGKVRRE
jgi:hypothetical protein